MAISATIDARRDELLRVARLCGENLSRHAFGERGPDLKVIVAVERPCVHLVPKLSPKILEMAEYAGFAEPVERRNPCFARALRSCDESEAYLGCKRSWVQIPPSRFYITCFAESLKSLPADVRRCGLMTPSFRSLRKLVSGERTCRT